ncbi:hypothetical protein OG883_11240 [Streptomyces sp. NBC_01142]|uniref:hypothetical protein n=1 Tax=Streptomyces sp. NBC_01142 TaxID=2975865 RepID=UPI00225BF443|nr:hypothetical protein [Streptomyces sp. NBC_01142]MCX4820470.1 hypothetical protein [Streptomyces sp. NBC_01142]
MAEGAGKRKSYAELMRQLRKRGRTNAPADEPGEQESLREAVHRRMRELDESEGGEGGGTGEGARKPRTGEDRNGRRNAADDDAADDDAADDDAADDDAAE